MATVQLQRQKTGELIPQETIEGVTDAIAENFKPEKIILFGSYASGFPTPDSDLDLLVVMDSDQPRYKRSVPIRLMFTPVPCAMDILVYTPDEVEKWNGATNHIVTEAHLSGKVIYDRTPSADSLDTPLPLKKSKAPAHLRGRICETGDVISSAPAQDWNVA